MAKRADINYLAQKAKAYVRRRDELDFAFSDEANREMREYNFAMRMIRQELLIKHAELALKGAYLESEDRIAVPESRGNSGARKASRAIGAECKKARANSRRR